MIKLNNKNCSTAVKGTALGKCLILIDYLSKVILFEKGVSFDPDTDTLEDAKIQELIKNGKMVVLPEHLSFEDNSEEDVYETLPSGVEQFVRYGIKKLSFTYSNGICFGNALASLSSKKWDVAFVDSEGKLIVSDTGDSIKGFGTSYVRKGAPTLNNGSESTKDTLVIGFNAAGTKAMNEGISVVYPKDSVDWLELEGIHEVRIQAENTTASAFRVSILDGCSETPINGLTSTEFWKLVDDSGSVVTPTNITENNGIYTLTGVSADTYDVSLNGVIVDDADDFYKSNVLNVTLA